jgi:type IV pilus assembly protein PilA
MKGVMMFKIPSRGFSLVELLVVIAVIAVIASLAIPSMLGIANDANYAKDRRNAQTVAVVASAAKAAGATIDLSTTNAISALQPPGVTAQLSGGATLPFSVSEMNATEQTSASAYLTNNPDTNGAVIFKTE